MCYFVHFDDRMKSCTFISEGHETNFSGIIDEIEVADWMRTNGALRKTSGSQFPPKHILRIDSMINTTISTDNPLMYGVIIAIGQIFVFGVFGVAVVLGGGRMVRSKIERKGLCRDEERLGETIVLTFQYS